MHVLAYFNEFQYVLERFGDLVEFKYFFLTWKYFLAILGSYKEIKHVSADLNDL